MSRELGTLNLPGNIEPQIASTLDARAKVQLKADLVNSNTFGIYAYKGMIVTVYNDTLDNNGIYRLQDLPNTNIENWSKVVTEKPFLNVDEEKVDITSLKAPIIAGVTTLPTYQDNENGSIVINGDGIGNFCTTADGKSHIVKLNFSTQATFTLTDNTVNYIFVTYNNGTPIYGVMISPSTYLTDFRILPLYRIARIGNELCILDYDEYGSNYSLKNLYKDISINGFQRLTGLELSTTATRISTINQGNGWFGGTFKILPENKANTTGKLYEYYLVSGVWNRSEVLLYDAIYYSDGIDRKTLDSTKYVAKYFYRFIGDANKSCYFHGKQYLTKNEAIIEEIPDTPTIVSSDTTFVGKIVIQQGATNGEAFSRNWIPQVNVQGQVNYDDIYGFQNVGIDKRTPINSTELSIDYTHRILTINPLKGEFNYFIEDDNKQLVKRTQVGTMTFPAFSNTSGLWYFYIDNTGIPRATQNIWTNFSTICPILRISWNSTKVLPEDRLKTLVYECHQNTISAIDHTWKHSFGAVWLNGYDIFSNSITTGTPNPDGRNTCYSLSDGACLDDNLYYGVTNTATPLNDWKQDLGLNDASLLTLNNAGIFNVRYKGIGGESELVDGTRFPFLFNPVSNIPQYINANGDRVDVSSGYYFIYFTYSIQDPRKGQTIRITPYQGQFSSAQLTQAQAITWEAVQLQDPMAKDLEIRPLYKHIFEYRSNYSPAIKYTAQRYKYDIRKMPVAQGNIEI